MAKRSVRIFLCVVLIAAAMLSLASCVNRELSEGVNTDERTFLQHKDYQGYIYKNGDTELPYRFREPPSVEEGAKYPLVIFLHGAGERGNNNRTQIQKTVAKALDDRGCYVFAPQCPKNLWWDGLRDSAVSETLDKCIEYILTTYEVDENRVYITGLSMGGFGTSYMVKENPQRYAAAVCVCGAIDADDYSAYVDVLMWVAHSSVDKVVSVEVSRKLYNAVTELGGDKIIYTEYDNMGHSIWNKFYGTAEVWDWLFFQSRERAD